MQFDLRRLTCIVSLSSLVLLLASCSTERDGLPSVNPSELSNIPKSDSNGFEDSFSVDDPLSVEDFYASPCGLVPVGTIESLQVDAEAAVAKLPENDPVAAEIGPYCDWAGSDHLFLSVGIESGNTERGTGGLDGIYALYEQGRYTYWEETSSSGYPAAYTGLKDRRGEGSCELVVGVADDMTFSVMVDVYSGDPQDACGIVDEVAADVIQNLQEAN